MIGRLQPEGAGEFHQTANLDFSGFSCCERPKWPNAALLVEFCARRTTSTAAQNSPPALSCAIWPLSRDVETAKVEANARTRLRRWPLGGTVALAVVLVTLGSVSVSSARIPPLLTESTHPGFFQFEMGPAISLHKSATQFKMAMAGGYHVFGTGDGPALGASMQFGFSDGYFSTAVGPRFWWDIEVVSGLGLYLTPVAQVGYSLLSNGSTNHYLHLQFGFEPRLVLNDRGVIFLRFFSMDVMFGSTVAARYDLMVGGGVTF